MVSLLLHIEMKAVTAKNPVASAQWGIYTLIPHSYFWTCKTISYIVRMRDFFFTTLLCEGNQDTIIPVILLTIITLFMIWSYYCPHTPPKLSYSVCHTDQQLHRHSVQQLCTVILSNIHCHSHTVLSYLHTVSHAFILSSSHLLQQSQSHCHTVQQSYCHTVQSHCHPVQQSYSHLVTYHGSVPQLIYL